MSAAAPEQAAAQAGGGTLHGVAVTSLLLASFAQVAEGKLFIGGGVWEVAYPEPSPFAIALVAELPWNEGDTAQAYRFVVRLINLDGEPVGVQTPTGEEMTVLDHTATIQPGPRGPGRAIKIPIAVNGAPIAIPPGSYEWRLWINDVTEPLWSVDFVVPEVRS